MGLDVCWQYQGTLRPVLVTARCTVNWCMLDSHVVPATAAPGTHKPLVVVPEIRFYPALADYQNMYDVDT